MSWIQKFSKKKRKASASRQAGFGPRQPTGRTRVCVRTRAPRASWPTGHRLGAPRARRRLAAAPRGRRCLASGPRHGRLPRNGTRLVPFPLAHSPGRACPLSFALAASAAAARTPAATLAVAGMLGRARARSSLACVRSSPATTRATRLLVFPPPPSSVRRPIWPFSPHRHGRGSASSCSAVSAPPCFLPCYLCASTGAARPRIEFFRAQSEQCARLGLCAALVGALLRRRAAMHAAGNLQRPTRTPNRRDRSASRSHTWCAPRRSQPAPETAAAPPCQPPERRPPSRPGQGRGRGFWAERLSLAAATACWAGPCARVSALFLFFCFAGNVSNEIEFLQGQMRSKFVENCFVRFLLSRSVFEKYEMNFW